MSSQNGDSRIVGIVGTPYCGSTMLARLFGGLNGVSSPGELCHLAVTSKVEGGMRRRKPESGSWPVTCAKCGYACPIFTRDYILKDHVPMEVYQDVARRLGEPAMVVADKDPAYFEAGIAPGLMDGIVLFKRPEAAVFSIVKRKGNALHAMTDWCSLYGKALSWADTFCRRVVYMSYEEVAATPVAALRALCTKLELPAPEHDYRWMPAKTYHYLGGNGGTHTTSQVRVDTAWVDALPAAIANHVQEHSDMQRIFEDMMARRLVLDGTPPAS